MVQCADCLHDAQCLFCSLSGSLTFFGCWCPERFRGDVHEHTCGDCDGAHLKGVVCASRVSVQLCPVRDVVSHLMDFVWCFCSSQHPCLKLVREVGLLGSLDCCGFPCRRFPHVPQVWLNRFFIKFTWLAPDIVVLLVLAVCISFG
jgi:hypothetical protein